LIWNGHLVPTNERVYIDTENLQMKPFDSMAAGFLAVVNKQRDVILWAHIRHEAKNRCQYKTKLTGLTPEIVENGVSLELVRRFDITFLNFMQYNNVYFISKYRSKSCC